MEYISKITKVTITPVNQPIYSELATHIEIDDEAAGEYVKVSQQGGHTDLEKHVVFEADSWPVIRDEIEKMIANCRDYNDK